MEMLEFVDLEEKHLSEVKNIYDYYILNSTATFHTDPITIAELKNVIPLADPKYKSYLLKYDGEVCGYCYIGQYKKRQAYDRTAELTIYLKPEFFGKGIGRETIKRLENIALENSICVLVGIITGNNESSIRLFEKCGYSKCAHYREVGQKFGKILDVVAYQKIIL